MSDDTEKPAWVGLLYDKTEPKAAALASASPGTAPAVLDLAEALYGGDEARLTSLRPAFKPSLDILQDSTGMTAAERDAHLLEVADVFEDARIPQETATQLHALVVHHMDEPADDGTVRQWETETRRALREKYGQDEAPRRLEKVKAFVAARPALLKTLNETGLGSSSRLILALAENTATMRMTPRSRPVTRKV